MTDPIDRTHRLYSDEFGECNPDRIHVTRYRFTTDWIVWRGNKALHRAPTHTEAIRWAQFRWVQSLAVLDRHPDAARYRLDSSWKPAQDGRTGAPGGPNYTHVISGPQNGSNEFDTFPEPMEAP